MMSNFDRQLIKAALSIFAKVECPDMFSDIQRMAVEITGYLRSVNSCKIDDAQRHIQQVHGNEYSITGILGDDIIIAVAILIDNDVATIEDGDTIKFTGRAP